MEIVKYKITGVCPILMHNINSMLLKKPRATSHEDWEVSEPFMRAKSYLEGDKFILPPRLFFGLLKAAAKRSGIKQPGKRSSYEQILKSVVFITDGMNLNSKFEDHEKEQAFVTVNKSKVLRCWPKLNEWSGIIEITNADTKALPTEVLTELLEFSGRFVGLGDYRPSFGRFKVEKI